MIWASSYSEFEMLFTGLFILFYGLYIGRTVWIGQKLGNPILKIIPKVLVRGITFILLLVALMGPSFGEIRREVKTIGKDIFICLDLSESMNAFDIQPSRLERIKFEMKNILEAFSSDRIGLIMFSNEAFMQCPLTYDNNALNLFIQTLNTRLVPNTGTNFEPPLRMAFEKLQEEESAESRQKSQIIIMISDGEDFGEETDDIAEEIENADIRLFTLGVGDGKRIKNPD